MFLLPVLPWWCSFSAQAKVLKEEIGALPLCPREGLGPAGGPLGVFSDESMYSAEMFSCIAIGMLQVSPLYINTMTAFFLLVCSLGSHQLSVGFSPLEIKAKVAVVNAGNTYRNRAKDGRP